MLQRLIFKRARVQAVEFRLGFLDGLFEHPLAVARFVEFFPRSIDDVESSLLDLRLDFSHAHLRFAVLGVIRAVMAAHFREFFVRFVERFSQLLERFPLDGNLRGGQRIVVHGFEGGLFADTIALRGGIFVVQLQQTCRDDIGFFVGVHHAQVPLELVECLAGPFHLGLELLQLPFHEFAEPRSRLVADGVGVQEITLRDGVGDVGRELPVRRAVADLQDVSIRRPGHAQGLQDDGRFQAGRAVVAGLFESVFFNLAETITIHHRPQDGIGLNEFDLRR